LRFDRWYRDRGRVGLIDRDSFIVINGAYLSVWDGGNRSHIASSENSGSDDRGEVQKYIRNAHGEVLGFKGKTSAEVDSDSATWSHFQLPKAMQHT
jgi:hypothetical protein